MVDKTRQNQMCLKIINGFIQRWKKGWKLGRNFLEGIERCFDMIK
jgi:GTPase involved in cell partitioning and DNA repair